MKIVWADGVTELDASLLISFVVFLIKEGFLLECPVKTYLKQNIVPWWLVEFSLTGL